jgi:hypothetical protein
MKCLVLVKFLPGGSLPPEEFFRRLNAQWHWLEGRDSNSIEAISEETDHIPSVRSAVCLADYESIEQLTIDLSIMPGAGISSVEVVSISQENDIEQRSGVVSELSSPLEYNKIHHV